MSGRNKKEKLLAEQYCFENGYMPCGANWYRRYGEGLLQVVSFDGLRRATAKQCAAISFYSMYEKIMWIDFNYMRVRRDVIPNISPADLVRTQKNPPQTDGISDLELMWNYGFPLLDTIDTHRKLAHLREALDTVNGQKIIMNDSSKLVPYLLSGQTGKSLAVIDAIEQQNRQAYEWNRIAMADADHELAGKKMETKLAPLHSLKELILSAKWQDIAESLQANYHLNIGHLSSMGIPVPSADTNHVELVRLLVGND